MEIEIRPRGHVEAFGRKFIRYDFPALIDFIDTGNKSILLETFPYEAKPNCEDGAIPLFHFPTNIFDHYAYLVARWYRPATLLLFDEHGDDSVHFNRKTNTHSLEDENIGCACWVAHLLHDRIISKSIQFNGMYEMRCAHSRTTPYGPPDEERSENLEELVKRNIPEKGGVMVHFDPDFIKGYQACDGGIEAMDSDVTLEEARNAISLAVNSPNLVSLSIGEINDGIYRF